MDENPRVLVVDDESVIAGAAEKILGSEGFVVRSVNSAEAALPLVHTEPPEIMLVDLMLPGHSGMDLLGRVARDFPQTAVIMMTGFSTSANVITFLKSGALDFLPKPFSFEELISTVRRAHRYLSLPAGTRQKGLGHYRHRLGICSWVAVDPDGTARLGITSLFIQIIGRVTTIEFPAVNDELRQGGVLAQVLTQDELKHTAWSALGGRVIDVNPLLQDIRDPHSHESLGDGWLVRIMPDNLEGELLNLSTEVAPLGDAW